MDRRARMLLFAAIVLIGMAGAGWAIRQAPGIVKTIEPLWSAHAQRPVPAVPLDEVAHRFSTAEIHAFLVAAKQAELIKDPLQRCLVYPNPPGSHWSAAAVSAFCNYRLHSTISFSQVQELIQNGQAADVDRRLAQVLQAQLTQPSARGLLDRIFELDFSNGSFDVRPTLDAWKRDSPNSAYAYAASGSAYVAMALQARGGDTIQKTQQSNLDAMDRLLQQAAADLQRAIELDLRITPAYSAMIVAGGLGLGRPYAFAAAKRGLALSPDNYAIFNALVWLEEPKWGGSLYAMKRVTNQAQVYAGDNPLLLLLLSEEPLYEVENCNCTEVTQLDEYPAGLDQVANVGYLARAGYAASSNNREDMAAVFLSETLRFNPAREDVQIPRAYGLIDFDEAKWAVTELSRVLTSSPRDQYALKARGYGYDKLNDYTRAEEDYQAAIALNPDDMWTMTQLGQMYAFRIHDWDKSWTIADQMIKAHPENPDGWILRASIQLKQPRVGMKDTVDYFEAHFGGDPRLEEIAKRLRAQLAAQTSPRYAAPYRTAARLTTAESS